MPSPERQGIGQHRIAAGIAALQQIDEYKFANSQNGSATMTVNYTNRGREKLTVSDTVRIAPGTTLEEASRLVKIWLDAVVEQEINNGDSGANYELQIQIAGRGPAISGARTTRTRTDDGPTIIENSVDTVKSRH